MKRLRKVLSFLGWLAFGFLMGLISLFGTALWRFGWTNWKEAVGIVLSFAPLLGCVWVVTKGKRYLKAKGVAAGLLLFLLTVFAGNVLLSILARAGWMQVIP